MPEPSNEGRGQTALVREVDSRYSGIVTPQVPQRHHRYHRGRFAEFLRYIATEGRLPTYREDGGRHSLRIWFDNRLRIGGRTARWARDDPELLDWIVDYARMIGLRT